MRAEQIRQIDTTDLKNQLRDQEETLFRLKFQIGMGQMDGVKKMRELKKDRARMLSVLRERELKEAGK
jgi:large subunit ribosomal protein L29